jgi:hypothetical protein
MPFPPDPPFLEIDPFTTQFGRPLSAAEKPVATRVLQVVSDWIRGQKPDVDPTAAEQVVFEVTRDQTNLGQYSPFLSFQNITAHRQEAATLKDDDDLLDEVITPRQKRFLGIQLRAAPRGHFQKCDFGDVGPSFGRFRNF